MRYKVHQLDVKEGDAQKQLEGYLNLLIGKVILTDNMGRKKTCKLKI